MASKRLNVKAILADADLRRKLMVSTIQATQAREGIDTSREQADRAYCVVTEAERATFFSLKLFKSVKDGALDRRHEMFVRILRNDKRSARFDVSRLDFGALVTSPLAYEKLGHIAHVFRDAPSLEPGAADVRRGAYAGEDARYVRMHWEVPQGARVVDAFVWVPFAKGGDYCRFYYDFDLLVHWDKRRRTFAEFHGRKGRETARPESLEYFFRPGLTWPLRTQRGLNVRVMPEGHVFANVSPAIFVHDKKDESYVLGVLNTRIAEYLALCFAAFGAWQTGVLKRVPVPHPSRSVKDRIGSLANDVFSAKATWDTGNETSTRFSVPWMIHPGFVPNVGDGQIPSLLDQLAKYEASQEARIRVVYSELNDEVYRIYGITDGTRRSLEEELGDRPLEYLWPQMEGNTAAQKRLEHVWRLLSFAVKRVIETDADGIVPFSQPTGETQLVDRVRQELAALFPGRDESQLEVEIVNELKRGAKGYRKCASLDDWLANAFFEYHASLYKSRPIFWHIASSQGTVSFAFGALVHYHRFDKNRMAKLRASYVRDAIEELRREAGLADKTGRAEDRVELQAKVEEVQALDKKLQQIQEGHHEGPQSGAQDFRILTPWKERGARPKGWNPDLDDGVKVNLAPLDRAGVLRVTGVAG